MSSHLYKIPSQILNWIRLYRVSRRLKSSTQADRIQAHTKLAKLLEENRGATMKFGQLMAGNTDDSPYQSLVTSIKPQPLERILPTLETIINSPVSSTFKVFDSSNAAASIGQVHHAILQNGNHVAVKIRYPDIEKVIKAELKIVNWMPSAGPFKRWRFDTYEYKNTLHHQILREIDYSIEAQTQRRFKQKLQVEGLRIPEIYSELCYEAVLTQSWETGHRFSEVCNWSKKDRLEIGRTLLMTLFQSLFVHGEIHGDPHPGNYLFRHDDQNNPVTILLDYGCTVLVSKSRRLALLKLIDAFNRGKDIDPIQCFTAIGFNANKLEALHDELPKLCEILFQPFLIQGSFDTSQWQLSHKLNQLLDQKRWWFRAAGPADLMLLLRAFHGLNQQLTELKIALPWWPILQFVVGEQLIKQARSHKINTIKTIKSNKFHGSAKKLCVVITENSKPDFNLELPAEAVLELDSMIPISVLSEIQNKTDFNFSQLTDQIRLTGLNPQLIFESKIGLKKYKVWLE